MGYNDFLDRKRISVLPSGFDPGDVGGGLYDFQRDLVRWACRRGKAALFTMTGTGKTAMQLAWAEAVRAESGRPVLILAPLAVAQQTVREGKRMGIGVKHCRTGAGMGFGVNITNYEMLHAFSPDGLGGIVLDESSIIKALDGKTRKDLIAFSRDIPYKLPCSATPSPNDYMELGNHAEFLGVMSHAEMLATFFTHDGGETSKWRLKGHAEGKFWEWLASWSAFMVKPSDLGYSDDGFDLPPLNTYQHVVESHVTEGTLFVLEARGLQERQAARRESIDKRVEKCVEIVESGRVFEEQWVVWCDLNAEQDALAKFFGKLGVSIYGSLSSDEKERRLDMWLNKEVPILITKPSIFGYGLNLQQCHNTVFVGLSDSFESIFQATRRFYRYGQTEPVDRHLIISGAEGSVLSNINRKEHEFMRMIGEMVSLTAGAVKRNIRSLVRESEAYTAETEMRIPAWLKSEKR